MEKSGSNQEEVADSPLVNKLEVEHTTELKNQDSIPDVNSKSVVGNLVDKYVDTPSQRVSKESTHMLLLEYFEESKDPAESVFNALQAKCKLQPLHNFIVPNDEAYALEQILEALQGKEGSDKVVSDIPKKENDEPAIVTLKVSPELKYVPVEAFFKHSTNVLKRKLLTHFSSTFGTTTPEDTLVESLKEMFTQGCFAILPMNSLKENLSKPYFSFNFEEIAARITTSITESELESILQAFIAENTSLGLVAVDLNNEFNLYTLPKVDIKRSLSPNPTPVADNAFLETLKNTIEMYESLLAKQKSRGENTAHTEQLLGTLRKQLISYGSAKSARKDTDQSMIASSVRSSRGTKLGQSIKERRMKAFTEIFRFYTKQRALAHVRKTFEAVQSEMDSMSLGYYVKFLKDFQVPIDLKKVKELFIKVATAGRVLTFEKFVELTEKVAQELTKAKILKRKEEIKEKVQQLQAEDENTEKFMQLKSQIAENEAYVNSLEALTPQEIIESFWNFLGLHDQNIYRKKLTGFQSQPFSVREKDTQRLPKELVEHYKVQPKEVTEKIKEEIKRLREEKTRREGKQPPKMPSATNISVHPISKPSQQKPVLMKRKKNASEDTTRKITLMGLGSISYKDLPALKGDAFDPASLVSNDEDDTECKEILKKFEHKRNETMSAECAVKEDLSMLKDSGIKSKPAKMNTSIQSQLILRQGKSKGHVLSNRMGPLGTMNPYETQKKNPASKPGSNSSASIIMKNMSLHRMNQIEKERELRESKNLERILQLQNEKINQGISVVKKIKGSQY